jgi:hypothetical protein
MPSQVIDNASLLKVKYYKKKKKPFFISTSFKILTSLNPIA